ncbi:DNA repair protein Rad2p [[Candida] jaroonii]|uniref:DNA repair protein Rad2p n=1 Tax=[Candida] jaroonii TaxID=467808 RepID=A0ACA9Y705_9ASCO|nr:DNA repair protein Rad2p [[Candida] jaroonii]
MGVNSLWDILGPTARTVRLEALTRRKLAVDASIWIYQFLKAVRDSEGNTLHQSHIVGFFRRICKLLYFGILPIFVFDGGAPALKRETIQKRRERREGKRESAIETAHRLLAIHVQRQSKKRTITNDDEVTYLDDLSMTHPQHVAAAPRAKRFIAKDEYHLPDLKKIKVRDTDERLMPEEEFNELAGESFDVVDGININEVDPKSEEFSKLPMPTQYMILSHLRLKSRLRLGYTKEQLQQIFDDSMDFSKFQIQQVQRRNFFTQRLMDVSGMGDDGNATRRIAGEKDRKYTLMRTNDGWALSLGEGSENRPIEIEDQKDGLYDNVELSTQIKDTRTPPKKSTLKVFAKPVKKQTQKQDLKKYASQPVAPQQPMKLEELSDSDDDFEDIPLVDEAPHSEVKVEMEEDPEQQEVEKALVASIYDQYKDEQPQDEGFSQGDLQKAIEESKKDLFKMEDQIKESDMQESTTDLDFTSSVLFGPPVSEASAPASSNTVEVRDLPSKVTESTSILGKKEYNSPVKIPKEFHPVIPQVTTVTIDELPDDKSKETDIKEIEAIIDSEDEKAEKKRKNKMPDWFNDKLDQQAYSYKVADLPSREEIAQEDEEAGLISWNDAKHMLDQQEEVEDDSEEVEITKVTFPKNENEVVDLVEDTDTTKAEADKKSELEREPDNSGAIEATEPKSSIHRSTEEESITENLIPEEASLSNKNKTHKPKQDFLDYEFIEDDDKAINQQLASEYQDHEDLKNQIKISSEIPLNSNTSVTDEQLLQERLQKQKRDAEEVTETMINDVQELLRRFGIPFITAPMEAEAQCAELLKLGLVDGIITDDSDCFLFGGDRIYKNMFNQKQYVECYMNSELQRNLGLDQHKLIELGLLLGSDYTEGIKGIGPVLAMEILAEFGNLVNFKKWFDNAAVGQIDSSTTLKKNLATRVKTGKLFLPPSFPDPIIFDAYTTPEVDSSKDPIKWGIPDLDQIRSFLMYNVGWSQARVDEVMVPLIRDMNKKAREGTQSTINEFFPVGHTQLRKDLKIGKRLKAAANKMNKQ